MDGKIQWHPAFCSALRIALADDMDALEIEQEHLLGKKPMQIDILIIKKQNSQPIKRSIGHIFRGHNLIEYKSPEDTLSVNDFYKVLGYACFYQSDTKTVLEIPPDDITVTFVCCHYPRKFLTHIRERMKMSVQEYAPGIYFLNGGLFPTQLLLTHQLSAKDYYWMQNLRKDLKSGGEIRRLIERYDANKNSRLYQSVMDVILRANWKEAEVERKMCEALKELFEEDFKRREQIGWEQGEKSGREIGLRQGEKIGEASGIRLAKKVFHLAQQGAQPEDIALACGISVETVKSILE